MDTDCNALYRYSIRHRVAKWMKRGEGKRATRTRPRSTISNKSLVLIVTFATWSSFVPINLKRLQGRQAIDRFGFVRKQLILLQWRSREEASTSIACSAIDGGGKKFDGGTRETCGPNIPETFKHTATPARANWSELELDLGQLSPYPVCRRISLDGDIAEDG